MKYLGENFVVKIKTWFLNKLSDKANVSDVLLKKSINGGYYIENAPSKTLGTSAFSANSLCNATGKYAFSEGDTTIALGDLSHAEGVIAKALEYATHAEGESTEASGRISHAEGKETISSGYCSHTEGFNTKASGRISHAEGSDTIAVGLFSHAQGYNNVPNENAIHSIGIGYSNIPRNSEYVYAKSKSYVLDSSDPKNGYKYLIGVGGYDGISTDNSKYKSVQEVLAELTAGMRTLWLPVTAASGDAVAMEANKAYEITVGETLTLTLTAAEDTTIVNEWQGTFDTGSTAPTVTWPADVIWAETPSVEANTHYEFNIRYTGGKYYGLVQEWNINTLEGSV